MKPNSYFIFTLLISTLSLSCAELKELASVQKPTLSVENVQITEFSLQHVELTFDIGIDNPNPVAVTLNSYDYDFRISENSFVNGDQPLDSSIPASGTSTVSVPVSFTFDELYEVFSSLRDKDETTYAFLANVDVQVPVLGIVSIPIEKDGVFPVVKLPSLSVSGFRVSNLSFTKAEVELDLDISNPNGFSLELSQFRYAVNLNGFSPVSGVVDRPVEFARHSSNTVTIPASFNLTELGISAYQILRGNKELQYDLEGSANVGADLPFFNNSRLDFDRSGVVNIRK